MKIKNYHSGQNSDQGLAPAQNKFLDQDKDLDKKLVPSSSINPAQREEQHKDVAQDTDQDHSQFQYLDQYPFFPRLHQELDMHLCVDSAHGKGQHLALELDRG